MTIRQEVSRLKMKYQTDDPYEICEYLDIQVMERPMGKSPRSCKGFFLVSSRCKLIVINSDLPDSIQRIIIAHELGHAVLHSDSAINTFHEFAMFEDTNRMEYSDYQVKEEVRKARDRYIEMGAAAGFEMAPITWTQKQKGVDDLYKHLFRDK